jgi:hypothetical protein
MSGHGMTLAVCDHGVVRAVDCRACAERACVVAWLRETGRYDNPWHLLDVADAIERGLATSTATVCAITDRMRARMDAHLCYSQDGSSCHKWITFTDPGAWRFESQDAAEKVIEDRELTDVIALEHGWSDVRADEAKSAT